LAEEFAARLVNGRVDRQTGWDVVRPDGTTVEVKFRSLGFGAKGKSGHTVVLRPVQDFSEKEADNLFLFAYNPALKSVDLFSFPKEVYKSAGAYIYYSTASGDYTENGGKKFLVDRKMIQPALVYSNHRLKEMQTFGVTFSDIESQEAKKLMAELQALKLTFF
jgi:hypothetical protein